MSAASQPQPALSASDAARADGPLVPAAAAPVSQNPSIQPPTAAIATGLAQPARRAGKSGLLYMASSERRADEIGRALRELAPDVEVLVLPPWDCLPYDRASPSRESMGRRMAVLARLSETADGPRVLVSSPEALLQRVPPAEALKGAFLTVTRGEVLARETLEAFIQAAGYIYDDRIDEAGEVAILGGVVDIFPAAAERPVRLNLDPDGVVLDIRGYDPLTQRTDDSLEAVVIGPASELLLSPPAVAEEAIARAPGMEHRAPLIYGAMQTVFDCLPKAWVGRDLRADERCAGFSEQVAEAYEARRSLGEAGAEPTLGVDRLYLTADDLAEALKGRKDGSPRVGGISSVPNFALQSNPGRAFCDAIRAHLDAGRRVVLTGLPHELKPLARAVRKGLDLTPETVAAWSDALDATPGSLLAFAADLEAGFTDADAGLAVIAASDVLGGRAAKRATGGNALLADPDLRVGDVVIHEDHGVGVIRAIEQIEVAGAARDAVRLEYHGGAHLLAPVEEFDRIWRYGAEEQAVTLDRLDSDSWSKRRIALSAELDATAVHLVELARAREETPGPVLVPPRAAYVRFAARFPYPETPDQSAAIEAVLADMASGRMMNRLVCGDVGFGKTEVALRAAAAAALCGKQVAVVAPTTVLARQHFHQFRRRFAGLGLEVAHLSRLVTPAEAARVKAGLADGSIAIAVGTHALGGSGIAFADLGLLIIDEEQRLGAKLKQSLRALSATAHHLTMTATPIPRTMQLAMVGIEEVSVIATPPARRRPIRTFLAPFDAATVRTALLREQRRGGQSFIVAPRIEDLEPLARQLAEIAPELTVRVAHGQLPADEVDAAMVGFADGEGDVLLATNIIESGLDVPRANTMLVWRPDCFGLAQLHQLRGRVGRGRAQGVCYLLTDPGEALPEATRARLSTLEAFDRLGSGLEISARDLDLRGAGDLIGEAQAGHMKLIGAGLYQRLLTRAVRMARGEQEGAGGDWATELNVGLSGALPETYVPEPTVRINLYVRLARLEEIGEVDALEEELEDRFGPPPPEAVTLVALARLRLQARELGIQRIDAGPKAIALTSRLRNDPRLAAAGGRDGKLVLPTRAETDALRLGEIEAALRRLADGPGRPTLADKRSVSRPRATAPA